MVLITSASYVSSGIAAELGKMPPCMLPLQNKRLFQHLITLFCNEKIVISLPDDYTVHRFDEQLFQERGISIIRVPSNKTLGESVVYVLNSVGLYSEPLRILHGDTLVKKIPADYDICLYGQAGDEYEWTYVDANNKSTALVGYFSFSNQSLLIKSIMEAAYNFREALTLYGTHIRLKYEPVEEWLDFGIVSAFFRSRMYFTTERYFNNLKFSRCSVVKSSRDVQKIKAEESWFRNVPYRMKKYVPPVWSSGAHDDEYFYEIENYYQCTLQELFVFGNLELSGWKRIFASCLQYFDDAAACVSGIKRPVNQDAFNVPAKTISRLSDYSAMSGISLEKEWYINGLSLPPLHDIIDDLNKSIAPLSDETQGFFHGDFCFSNIFYNNTSHSIKIIDPRGMDFCGNETIYGDLRYDIAKLAHSAIGLYDFIVAGRYILKEEDPYRLDISINYSSNVEEIIRYFKGLRFIGKTIYELAVYPMTISLFLSMLPLHADSPERQKAFLANALRLYAEFREVGK